MLDKSVPSMPVLMVKRDVDVYPRFEFPEGYTVSGWKPGDEEDWAGMLFRLGWTDTVDAAREIFQKEFAPHPGLLGKRCLFVRDRAGKLAAMASLWQGDLFGETLPRLHWVACSPEAQGKGLAKALLTRLMDVYHELGLKGQIYLTSDTRSYKGLNIYLKFGFEPYLSEKPSGWDVEHYEETNRKAWELIRGKLEAYRSGN